MVRATDTAGGAAEGLYEIARITLKVQAACDLFVDDFGDGNYYGWDVYNGIWQIVGGKLQVLPNRPGYIAYAEAALLAHNYFLLQHEVEVDRFDGSFYGLFAWSTAVTYSLAGHTLRGVGVRVDTDGKVGFLGYDTVDRLWVLFEAGDYGPVRSLGLEWGTTAVKLLVNGAARQSLAAASTDLLIDRLWLMSMGNNTSMRFDNVCQTRLPQAGFTEREAPAASRSEPAFGLIPLRLIEARLPADAVLRPILK